MFGFAIGGSFFMLLLILLTILSVITKRPIDASYLFSISYVSLFLSVCLGVLAQAGLKKTIRDVLKEKNKSPTSNPD